MSWIDIGCYTQKPIAIDLSAWVKKIDATMRFLLNQPETFSPGVTPNSYYGPGVILALAPGKESTGGWLTLEGDSIKHAKITAIQIEFDVYASEFNHESFPEEDGWVFNGIIEGAPLYNFNITAIPKVESGFGWPLTIATLIEAATPLSPVYFHDTDSSLLLEEDDVTLDYLRSLALTETLPLDEAVALFCKTKLRRLSRYADWPVRL